MLESLADFRFAKAIHNPVDEGYLNEIVPETAGQPKIWAAWAATGDDREAGCPRGPTGRVSS